MEVALRYDAWVTFDQVECLIYSVRLWSNSLRPSLVLISHFVV